MLPWADVNPETGQHAKASAMVPRCWAGLSYLPPWVFMMCTTRPSHHNKQNHNPVSGTPLLSPGLVLPLHPRAASAGAFLPGSHHGTGEYFCLP